MSLVCISRWCYGVTEDLCGKVEETFVCDEHDNMALIGWILTKLAQGFDISIEGRFLYDYGKEGVNNNTES